MELRQKLEEIIAAHPSGITPRQLIVELRSGKISKASPATIRRHLSALLAEKRVIAEGKSAARIYKPSLAPGIHVPEPISSQLFFEPQATEVQALVRRPLAQRVPVGYNPEFLQQYQPNKTMYFTSQQIENLHELGRSNMGERPAGTYARDILNRLLVDFSWASSRLEGNTYTVLDTKRLIEEGINASGKSAKEAQMILNHKRAIELLVGDAEHIGFNAYTLRNIHSTLAEGLMADSATEGRLRARVVEIQGSVYHPLPVPQQIEEYFNLILEKADAIIDAYEQAFFVMVHIPYLQPFEDVNKRVSRLAANIPFIRHNLCPLSFMDVPNDLYVEGILGIYELNRIELMREVFLWAYKRSCQLYPIKKAEISQPDPLKLKYRDLLHQLVRILVRRELPATTAALTDEVRALAVDSDEVEPLVRLTLKELQLLHEGNFARYGIRPNEFEQWAKIKAKVLRQFQM